MNSVHSDVPRPFGPLARWAVLLSAFLGLVFAGIQLGLMPVASLSVSRSILGSECTHEISGAWFARYTAILMLGGAIGGILLGNLGDRIGRTRAMGVSILCYSVFSGLGAWVTSQEQMLLLRFLVGLGVGGMWPNGVVLASECWPNASRPTLAGVLGAGINCGILFLSQLARVWPISEDSWRWVFLWGAIPGLLGILVLALLPESPKWLASRKPSLQPEPASSESRRATGQAALDRRSAGVLGELFRPPLLRRTVVGIVLASIPLVGAWAASKWMIPWADSVAGAEHAGYKAIAQGWWALGATLGSFAGAQVAAWWGRRRSYFLISLGTTLLTIAMFQLTAPLEPEFLFVVFAQGFVATLFFGWLPLYLPELFPTRVRATGSGLSMNAGRFATAGGVFLAGALFTALGGSYPNVGAIAGLVYGLGMVAIWFAPATNQSSLDY